MSTLLRWVGSKQWYRHELAAIVRKNIALDGTYWEPFAGSASLFFTLKEIQRTCICDTIEPLIRTYKAIQEDPMAVWKWTRRYAKCGIESYYEMRDRFNDFLFSRSQLSSEQEFAGLFVYLNACCFNGLWRQNTLGKYNVPVSDRTYVKVPKQRAFLLAAQALYDTDIRLIEPPTDIFKVIDESRRGDVVFADPPYYGTFDGYDGILLSAESFHEQLADKLQVADERGVFIMTMNSDKPFIRKLYKDWTRIKSIERYQTISGTNSGRGEWKQVLVVSK